MAFSASPSYVGIYSRGVRRIPFLEAFLGANILYLPGINPSILIAVAGWGRRPSSKKSRAYAQRQGLPHLALEDGFLRSYGMGEQFPPLALVVDGSGIYYDSTSPSDLENLLNAHEDLLATINTDVARAKQRILECKFSKYNHAPLLQEGTLYPKDRERILIVDQTFGDMSVALGGASGDTFAAMLAAARAENLQATIYVKTHPDVSSGRKRGYLTRVSEDRRTVVLREAVNPLSLIEHMDRVYVVSSTLGFEALLAGKQVTCFGLPWYAGWGVTDDRLCCPRRTRRRTVNELLAAAYFHYTR